MMEQVTSALRAVRRARTWILAVALTHLAALALGAIMVHAGHAGALAYRDRLVGRAHASDPVSLAAQHGDKWRAAAIETGRTQWACMAMAATGLTVVTPIALSAYRGWVGGIVSVDGRHASRLARSGQATYYLLAIVLQLIPYTLAGGAGIQLGLTYFRRRPEEQTVRWWGYPKEAVWDFLRVLAFIIPFVVVANLWEFLSPLNH